MSKKPHASARTIDIFSGKTAVEELESASADLIDEAKSSETIEQAAERWRNNAFFTEYYSSRFSHNVPNEAKFRLTKKEGMAFLEQYRLGKDGMAFHWSGVMFQVSDLKALAECVVAAYRAEKDNV